MSDQLLRQVAGSTKPCSVEYLVPGARGIAKEALVSLLPHPATCKCKGTGETFDGMDNSLEVPA